MPAIPWVIWAGLGLIGWRASEKASDELAAAVPWVLGGAAVLYVMGRR